MMREVKIRAAEKTERAIAVPAQAPPQPSAAVTRYCLTPMADDEEECRDSLWNVRERAHRGGAASVRPQVPSGIGDWTPAPRLAAISRTPRRASARASAAPLTAQWDWERSS